VCIRLQRDIVIIGIVVIRVVLIVLSCCLRIGGILAGYVLLRW